MADDTAGTPAGAITDAIRALEPGNPDHWTKAGKPRVKALASDNIEHWTKAGKPRVRALEEHLGYDITAADRDFAWKTVQAEQ